MADRNATGTIRVRLYNVGFGDCFLLEFPRPADPPFRVLVDCGSHSAGHPRPGWKIEETVATIVADLAGSPIDVVVATHRHQDHVSGFEVPAWSDVTVGEVWLPWTEDPDDPEATRIRTRQSSLALNLTNAFAQHEFQSRWASGEVKESLRAMVANSLTNETAMRTLHQGFAGKPRRRFVSSEDGPTLATPTCPGLTVHVLGPAKDEATIRDMDPPSGQSYLRFGAAPPPGPGDSRYRPAFSETQRPFPARFVVGTKILTDATNDQRIKDAAAGVVRDGDLATAVSLDKAVNGTSLMLVFEYGDAYLLFPGDAQWGTWNAALTRPATRELVSRTTFYKVGHHGSHNATPTEFLEKVLDPGAKMWGAAASVRPISFWPDIPRDPLMTALGQHASRVVRSDRTGGSQSGVWVRPGGAGVDFHVPC
jgi:beta-lactamase superfamily II metal-dependent hydrolase